MANPHVRPHLSFYPEDAAQHLSEARHGARWLSELPSELTTPMARIGKDDYYIFEPALISTNTHSVRMCMPYRWFTRSGMLFAKVWPLDQVCDEGGIDGWLVREDLTFDVSQEQFLKNFPSLGHEHEIYSVPHPSRIFGTLSLNIYCSRVTY